MVHEKERMEVHYETTTSDVQAHLGRVVQVDPIKPALKAPGIKRLNLKYEQLHSNFAFKFNLRRYTWANGSNAPTTSATPSTASSTRWRAPPRTAAPVRRSVNIARHVIHHASDLRLLSWTAYYDVASVSVIHPSPPRHSPHSRFSLLELKASYDVARTIYIIYRVADPRYYKVPQTT
jgi:hypothetical protein